jgi:hypothetical protein
MNSVLLEMLKDFYDNKKFGEIIIKIECGKIVRYEKKESIKP